jgi:hypothetical protein
MKTNNPSIDVNGFKISLLTVEPGKETSVAKSLQKAIIQETRSKPYCVLKTFGKYDLCEIYKSKDFLSGPSKYGSIDYIRGGNQILGFGWNLKSRKSIFELSKSAGQIWGIIFIRLNETLAKKFGSRIEIELFKQINIIINDKSVKYQVFSTTGWAEIGIFVRGRKFESVIKALSDISQAEIRFSNRGRAVNSLFAAKTYSIIGIDFNFILNKGSLLKHIKDDLVVGKNVYPQLSVICSPGDMHSVINSGIKTYGECNSTFGSIDVVFSPTKCKTWGEFLNKVIKFRSKKALKNKIYSTLINIQKSYVEKDFSKIGALKNNSSKQGRKLSRRHIILFKKLGPAFEHRLLNIYFGISNLMQDPLIGDCFHDLKTILNERLIPLLEKTQPDNEKARTQISNIIDAIIYGAQERIQGAFIALEHVEGKFSPTKGGIQRVLRALDYASLKVMNYAGLNFNGFTVAGYNNQGFYSYGEVINIPMDVLFKPEEWWGLFHEMGHAALYETNFVDLHKDNDLRKFYSWDERSPFSYLEKNMVSEISADMFDFYFCHDMKLDLYMSNILNYLGKDINSSRYLRYFCIFMIHKYLHLNRLSKFPSNIDFVYDLNIYKSYYKRYKLRLPSTIWDDEKTISKFKGFALIIEKLNYLYKRKIQIDIKKKRNPARLLNNVLKGKVYLEMIEFPDKFILDLKVNSKKLSHAARMAAILSLWNSSMIKDKIGKYEKQ